MNASGLRYDNVNIRSYTLALSIVIIGVYIRAISVSADKLPLNTTRYTNYAATQKRVFDPIGGETPKQHQQCPRSNRHEKRCDKSDIDHDATSRGTNNTGFSGTPEEELSKEIHEAAMRYRGFLLLKTVPKTDYQVNQLRQYLLYPVDGVSFWLDPTAVNRSVDIIVSPVARNNLTESLDKLMLPWSVASNDIVKDLISKQSEPVRQAYLASENHSFFETYQTFPAIEKHLQYLRQKYKGLIRIVTFAKSYENRPMYLVKLSSSGELEQKRKLVPKRPNGRQKTKKNEKNKKRTRTTDRGRATEKSASPKAIIWLDAGHHAREWVSQATCIYILETLLEDYTKGSKDVIDLFDKYDFYIVPVVNPDGYQYSHTHDRLWRKTRSKQKGKCYGVDPNRNYPHQWGTSGSSNNPCAEIFHGPKALSELETIAIADTILKYSNRIKLYLSLHAYGQLMLTPWAYKKILPDNYAELESLAKVAINAIASIHGTEYRFGTAANILYAAAGGSDDFAMARGGIRYAYTLELRDKKTFNLPESLIKPTAEETYLGFKAFAGELIRRKEY